MIFRNLIFQAEVVIQRLPAGLVSHHEQQASECEDKQRHRELWPAYNPNLAPPQASTEGLFQQTRLVFNSQPDVAQFGGPLLGPLIGPKFLEQKVGQKFCAFRKETAGALTHTHRPAPVRESWISAAVSNS
jgi:hypothetical protein